MLNNKGLPRPRLKLMPLLSDKILISAWALFWGNTIFSKSWFFITYLSFSSNPVGNGNFTILKYNCSCWLGIPSNLIKIKAFVQWLCELQTILFLIYKILLIVILQTSYITFLSFLPKLKPGVPFSTTSVEIPLGPDKMNEIRRRQLILILKKRC